MIRINENALNVIELCTDCDNEHEAKWLGKQGKCVALITSDDSEFLGEVDDTELGTR